MKIKKDVSEHIGEKYNRLLIIEYSHSKAYTKTHDFYYKCLCDCGNFSVVTISGIEVEFYERGW